MASESSTNTHTPSTDETYPVAGRIGRTPYRVDLSAAGHTLVADEPTSAGGGDAGPSPYDYLLAGLASCTAMTLRMYADRKDWPLDEVTVKLNFSRVHARDCEACESETGQVGIIERVLHLTGELSEAQRDKLIEIADKCPVHRTLTSETRITTVDGDRT